MPALHTRLQPFLQVPALLASIKRFDDTEALFKLGRREGKPPAAPQPPVPATP